MKLCFGAGVASASRGREVGAYYTTLELSTSTPRDRRRAVVRRSRPRDKCQGCSRLRRLESSPSLRSRGAGLNRIRLLRDKLYGLGFLSSPYARRDADRQRARQDPEMKDLQARWLPNGRRRRALPIGKCSGSLPTAKLRSRRRPSALPSVSNQQADRHRSLAFNFDEAKTEEPCRQYTAPEDDDFDLDDFDNQSDVRADRRAPSRSRMYPASSTFHPYSARPAGHDGVFLLLNQPLWGHRSSRGAVSPL